MNLKFLVEASASRGLSWEYRRRLVSTRARQNNGASLSFTCPGKKNVIFEGNSFVECKNFPRGEECGARVNIFCYISFFHLRKVVGATVALKLCHTALGNTSLQSYDPGF